MAIQLRDHPYRDGEVPLVGVFAEPEERGSTLSGVLVVHGGAGLDDQARSQAARFAGLGHTAFACDMFGDGVKGHRDRVMAAITGFRDDRPRLVGRVNAALTQLRQRPGVSGPIFVVGYCFGGLVALELARAGADIDGVVSVHGSLETRTRASQGDIKARLLVCHGALDPHVPMSQVATFADEMNAAKADYQLVLYGGAMHGFTHRGAAASVPGVEYHPLTDERSFRQIAAFFDEIRS